MIRKLLTTSVFTIAIALSLGAAEDGEKGGDGKGKGKGQGQGGDPAKRVEAMIAKLDTDCDGKVSSDEFAASEMAANLNKRKDGAADAYFTRTDEDSDGFLTEAELLKAAAARGGKGGQGGKGKDGKGGKGEKGDKPESDQDN